MADELKENIEQETKPSKKKSKLFWALLASGIGAVIIAVVLLVVFLMPKEEKFDINLGSSGTTSSVVLTGEGNYTKGDSVTIVAQDIEGYRFVNWIYKGNVVSDEREYTFVIGESTQGEYTANYARVYKIKASENQYGTFTINPTSAIAGEEITVEFEIGVNYQEEYTVGDLYYIIDGQVQENIIENNKFTMPEGNVVVYARINNLYNINLTSNISNSEDINLSGAGVYAENDSVTITAPYVEGYRFREWTYRGEVVSNSPTYIIENVNENTSGTYIANYDSPFSVTINMPSGTLNITAFVNDEMSFNCVLEDIITDKEIIKQKIQILAEGEELSYTEENGQFSFIMPASNVEINLVEDSKLSRITDFTITNNGIFSYSGSETEVTIPSSYYPYQQETGNILSFSTQQDFLNDIMNDNGLYYLLAGGKFSYRTADSSEFIDVGVEGYSWLMQALESYTSKKFPLEIILPTEYTVTLEDIKDIPEVEMAILAPTAAIYMSNNCLLSFTYQIGDNEPVNVDVYNSGDLLTFLEDTFDDNFNLNEILPVKYSNFKYGRVIPCVGDGVKIERLGASDMGSADTIFKGNTSITKVVVPEGFTTIGNDAFSGCTSLTEVSLPSTLKYIEGNAFSNCTSLSSIVIPEGVISINYSVFDGCTNLQSVDFGENSQLQTIGGSAFSGCTNLSTITIPDTVIEVGQDAFSGTKLTYIEDNNGRYLASATNQYCILIDVVDTNVTELTVSENCRIIANPFYNLNSLKKVTIPSSVVHIANTFSCDIYYQGSLEQWVDISYNGTSFGNSSNKNLYINNQKVEEIIINKDIKTGAFSGIASIKKVTLSTNVTSIGDGAFSGCINLTDVYYQGTLDQWLKISFDGEWARYTNINLYIEDELIEELTINKNIKDYAFNSVASLKKVTLGEDVTSIGYYAFSNCQNLTDIYYQGTLAQWLDMRFSGDQGWQNCNLYINNILVEEVNINRNIKDHAFSGFTSIKKVTLGEDVTSIGEYAFSGCTSLTSITIPENVTSIDYSAFYKCYSLAIVYNNSSLSISLGSSDNGHVGYYAYEIVDKEDTAKGKIEEINGIQYYINDVTQEFVAFAVATDRDAVVSATIDSRAKNLNQNIFINCNNLKEIIFEDNSQLQTIGSYVFQYCTSLQTVDFGDNSQLQTIGDWAFYNCTNLTSITIPSSVISIGNSAFLGTNLQTITFEDGSQFQSINGFIPSSIKHIIFEGNSSLISISDGTFSSSVNLQTIDFGDNSQLQTIGNSAFYGCSSLTTVDFGNNSKLQSIGDWAFADCTSLSSITIPSKCDTIGDNAFFGCDLLKTVTIESDDVYNAAVGVESNHAGGLLANAETVYVLKTIVDNEANSNEYLTSNFTRSESGDGLYYIYTKSNTTT